MGKREKGTGRVEIPFLRAFCFSALRWAAAGFMARSLSFAILIGWVSDGTQRVRLVVQGRRCAMEREVDVLRWMHDHGKSIIS